MAKISLRRLRQDPWIRELTQQIHISPKQFIQPHFVVQGLKEKEPIQGLTGVFRETPDSFLLQIEKDLKKGIHKILLFGVPGSKSTHPKDFEFTAKQIETIRKEFGKELWISVDVCLCSSTEHGQCGVVNPQGDHIENEATVNLLTSQSLQYAQAGADCIAPSDMMDGRIGSIRDHLDQKDYHRVIIMSYAAKFHSRFYGPFRNAADSAPKGEISLKDRSTYQIDPARMDDAIACAKRDAREGADILMVKPGLPYLDVIYRLSEEIKKPWAVYQVSGEYASIELMAANGLMNAPLAHLEAWTAFVRAGASIIISYGARNAKDWLHDF